MESRPRHYLDHAATTWPKPPGVLEACIDYQKNVGVAAGRGVYGTAEIASKLLQQTRTAVAELINADNSSSIAFCSNGTFALNAAIQGLLLSERFHGSHIVTTATEHNSVLRPLELLAKHRKQIEGWTAVPCDRTGFVDPIHLKNAMTSNTKMVIVNHSSNVTGALQDVQALGEIARSHHAIFVIDAAQTIGYIPIDVKAMNVDVLAAPGHKGLGGMLGTGVLYVTKNLQNWISPLWIGGTGTQSDAIDGPFDWQAAVESGNVNVPVIASLKAGIEWTQSHRDWTRIMGWYDRILEAIQRNPKLDVVAQPVNHMPVLSLTSRYMSCHELALLLDAAFQVEARSGFHCAGLIHKYLDTHDRGGTLRLSIGHTSTQSDIDATCAAIANLADLI